MRRALTLFLLLSAVPALAAEFEGVLEMKISTLPPAKAGVSGGTVHIQVGKGGMRSEVVTEAAGKPFTLVSLVQASAPNVTYSLDAANKTYQKFDNSQLESKTADPLTLKRLGTDTLLGRTVQHVLLTSAAKAKEEELWIDTSLVPSARFAAAFERGGDDWWATLKTAGLQGLPLKMIFRSTTPGSKQTVVEATNVQAKALPPSTFEIPAGYSEAKGPLGGQ